jgi:hypothetical protein
MKKKLFYLVMFNIVLALGIMVIGCDNGNNGGSDIHSDIQLIQVAPHPQISAPQVTAITGKYDGIDVVVLSWDAVENAGSYSVVRRQKDKMTIESTSYFTAQVNNQFAYTVSDGVITRASNDNADKWNAYIPIVANFGATVLTEYNYGVIAYVASYDGFQGSASNITWTASPYKMVEHPWNVLIGTWERDIDGDKPKIVIKTGMSGSSVIGQYTIYYADEEAIVNQNYGSSTSSFNLGTLLSDFSITNFYGWVLSTNTSYFDIKYSDGKLVGSIRYTNYEDTYSLNGTYTKKP